MGRRGGAWPIYPLQKPETSTGGTRRRRTAVLAAGLVLLLVVAIALFQWNWLRGPLAGMMSARMHRPVSIAGNLKVHPWSGSPWATVEGVTVANPAWAGGGAMARVPRITVRWRWGALFSGRPPAGPRTARPISTGR